MVSEICEHWTNKLTVCSVGGNDIFVDIGDKSWGVLACQRFLGKSYFVSNCTAFLASREL